ncbi:TPA: transposase [Aeromonas hydrophila]|uniref:transposase n=1 Tax=Aeromonas hydrophila TaxID=644 RepID=UPI00107EB86A|nr:transposase [Aeromonas hydrophila]QBX75445.1 transposase [Aeromonas hydrophila]
MVYTNSCTNGSRKGRANYSREFKQRLVDAANQPGVSVSKLAQEHGVNANLLFKWRRDAKTEAPALYPIELVLPPSSTELLLPPTPQRSRQRQPLNRHHPALSRYGWGVQWSSSMAPSIPMHYE